MKRILTVALLLSLNAPAFAQFTATADSLVKVQKTAIPLDSHLKKKFAAYKVEITNDSPATLKLDSASIDNGVVGQVAAARTKTSWLNVLWGLPFFMLGLGVASLIIYDKNGKADTEAASYPNQVPSNELSHGARIAFNVLVPIGEQPQLRLHFTNPGNHTGFDKVAALH
jgi:hypothetical protein